MHRCRGLCRSGRRLFGGGAEDFGGAGAAFGTSHEGFEESGHEGFEDSGREGIAEELGLEGTVDEALGLRAGFFDIAFFGLTAEASVAAAAEESSLNFLTATLACLPNLSWRLAHSSG